MKKFFVFCIVLVPCLGRAQSVFNKGATFTISPGAVVSVQQDFTNEGVLTNNGELIISGAWLNLGTYNPGNGQINFNSNAPQNINHNDQSFRRLVISGAGEKRFLANITIESELVLQNSLLRSQNNARIIFAPGATINGGSISSHIVGAVEHRGLGTWLYPIGDGTRYLPVTVSGVTDAGAAALLTLLPAPNAPTLSSDMASVSNQRMFDWQLLSGSIGAATLTLPLQSDEVLNAPIDRIVVAGSIQPSGVFESLEQSAVTGTLAGGTVTSSRPLAYRYYMAGALSDIRPIEVFNGMSPNIDDLNTIFRIRNIEFYPQNRVIIFNRWGDRIYEASGYNNDSVVFSGTGNVGAAREVPAGTYFYSIDLGNGLPRVTGYLELKR